MVSNNEEVNGGEKKRTPALRVQGLVFRRGREILKGVDWTVGRGEHWCLLGPNGCGKTSLINLITGYDSATAGSIALGDAVFGRTDWREVRKRVGCLYLRDAFWGPLSQGEKQKVLICRALMSRFEILILDEPCAGLDPVARERFLRWLQELMDGEGSPALVLVTHHVEEILGGVSHVLLMKDGLHFRAGRKEEVLTSEALSAVYGAAVVVDEEGGRYRLRVVD